MINLSFQFNLKIMTIKKFDGREKQDRLRRMDVLAKNSFDVSAIHLGNPGILRSPGPVLLAIV